MHSERAWELPAFPTTCPVPSLLVAIPELLPFKTNQCSSKSSVSMSSMGRCSKLIKPKETVSGTICGQVTLGLGLASEVS